MSKREFKSKGPELLADLAAHAAAISIELLNLDPDAAEQLGVELAERMAGHWGGQNLYFPMGLSLQLSKRDKQIYAEFDGMNHGDLARKYSVSVQWVYKIVKAARLAEMARRQEDLFTE